MTDTTGRRTVVIDGFNLGMEKGTGIATYARNLSRQCRELGYRTEILYGLPHSAAARDPLLREVSFFDPPTETTLWGRITDDVDRFRPRFFGVPSFEVPVTGEVVLRSLQARMPTFDRLWNATNLFRIAEVAFATRGAITPVRHPAPVDVMHWTYPLPVHMPGAKNIYTLHDLVPLRLPYTTLDDKSYYLRLMKRLVKQADHIVTVSETSRADIIRLLGCPEDKVTNTYQSVDLPASLLDKSEEDVRHDIEGAFGLPYKGYFLFFGAIEPKKNVGRLIEAYLASEVEEPLVLIGSAAWKADGELKLLDAAANGYQEQVGLRIYHRTRVRRFDYAPFSLLVSAIRGAKATIFPSLYEGFGLPVLESMLLGTPVITSTEGATREIAGDAALLVDPYDTRALASAIRELSSNAELRAELAAKGRRRATDFSPEHHRERLRAVYDAVAPGPTTGTR